MEIELGGGLRDQAAVERAFELGVNYAILGTSALRDRPLVERLAAAHGRRIIVGIDARDGKVAVEGWVETSDTLAVDFARELESIGVGTVIYTDIATDGMMTGPSIKSTAELADAVDGMNVIASGGIRNVMDLLALQSLARPNLIGAITGRAVYEKTLDIAEAVARLG
jgi:phosphoribosylformimino-5-aminoimidazole carboxamide ribotide isomerase